MNLAPQMAKPATSSLLKRSHAIIITGPAGVGKTATAHYLKDALHIHIPWVVRYLSGDMYSHISFPWVANNEQLDRKYDCLVSSIEHLVRRDHNIVLVVDDLFRRDEDWRRILDVLDRNGVSTQTFILTTELPELLARNAKRTGFQKAPEDQIREAFRLNGLINWTPSISVSADQETDNVVKEILSLFLCKI